MLKKKKNRCKLTVAVCLPREGIMTGSAISVRSFAFELQEPGRQQLKRPNRKRFVKNDEVRRVPPCIEYNYRK